MRRDHLNKANRDHLHTFQSVARLDKKIQELLLRGSQWGNQLAAGFELTKQRSWNLGGRAAHHDAVKGSNCGTPLVAVALEYIDIGV